MNDWQSLTQMTGGKPIVVERVRVKESGVAIEGDFELPLMARLSHEDQFFIAAFVKSNGSIKEMERLFGVSYPTIKNRLKRLSDEFDFVSIDNQAVEEVDVLDLLERGEISVEEAARRLKQ